MSNPLSALPLGSDAWRPYADSASSPVPVIACGTNTITVIIVAKRWQISQKTIHACLPIPCIGLSLVMPSLLDVLSLTLTQLFYSFIELCGPLAVPLISETRDDPLRRLFLSD